MQWFHRPQTPRRDASTKWCSRGSIVQYTLFAIIIYIAWETFSPYTSLRPVKSLLGNTSASLGPRAPCQGPRGKFIKGNNDDQIEELVFDTVANDLLLGSYEALPLERTWSSADGRYAPYGRGEDMPSYTRSKVDWSQVDWGTLQTKCMQRNQVRFGTTAQIMTSDRRMAYPTDKNTAKIRHRSSQTTGRTAIVLRGYEEFVFHPANHWHIRSLIAETALHLNGDYAVFILVDIHDENARIFDSNDNYDAKLAQVAPPEYRNMTVLFDEALLKAWYPKISNHGMRYQLFEPLQLFAHFFDDYDFYWQLEMDMRFLGHAGKILDSFSNFARNEPRKQARERASYMFTPQTYGSYENFIAKVNESLSGGSSFWRGIKIPDIEQVGPSPKVSRPEDDHFEYGVGEDADFIMTGPCTNMTLEQQFRGYDFKWSTYIQGFEWKQHTPRIICPPAMGRASWNLLNSVHNLQIEKGLQVPSELTMPSFALWLNMKISKVPFPVYVEKDFDPELIDKFFNGGEPLSKYHGMAKAFKNHAAYRQSVQRPEITWRSHSSYAKQAFFAWHEHTPDDWKSKPPRMLHVHEGKFYAPNGIVHPAKFNEPNLDIKQTDVPTPPKRSLSDVDDFS